MDKPVSISVKAWIIRQMSVRTFIQERVIETVVNHQFDSAYEALDKCNSLEFSGFGKFFFNVKKAYRKLEKFKEQIAMFNSILDNPETTDIRKRNIALKLQTTMKNFDYLSRKLNGHNENIRRMEESPFSIEGTEETDSEDS